MKFTETLRDGENVVTFEYEAKQLCEIVALRRLARPELEPEPARILGAIETPLTRQEIDTLFTAKLPAVKTNKSRVGKPITLASLQKDLAKARRRK